MGEADTLTTGLSSFREQRRDDVWVELLYGKPWAMGMEGRRIDRSSRMATPL